MTKREQLFIDLGKAIENGNQNEVVIPIVESIFEESGWLQATKDEDIDSPRLAPSINP